MAAPDPADILALAASSQERSEHLAERDAELLAEVERIRAWLASSPHLSDEQQQALGRLSAQWKASSEQRFELLTQQADIAAQLLPEIRGEDARKAEVLVSQAAVFDGMAATARLCSAMIAGAAAIDAQVKEA